MKQALHIFRKDVRHLRSELLVSAALLVAFCVVTPQTWMGGTGRNEVFVMVGSLLNFLLPMMWLVLIARAVQEERLVGDQQFWVTRPYNWRALLGGKALFVVVWVVVPFMVMQWAVLLEAGVHPWADVGAMLSSLVKPALILWLPFFAIAAVTLDLSRMFVVVLIVVVEWAALLMLYGTTAGSHTSAPFTPVILAVVTGSLAAGCVIYAYRTRRTRETRLALVGTSVVFFALLGCLVGVYLSSVTNVMMRWHYPVEAGSAIRLVMHPEAAVARAGAASRSSGGEWVRVHVPLLVDGLSEGQHLHDTNARFTLEAGGYHYDSPWRPAVPQEDGISLDIPAKVYERVQSGAVHLHVSLAATLLVPAETRVVVAQAEFDAPDGGHCVLADLGANNLVCRYAYTSPPPTWITARVTQGKCGVGKEEIAGNGTRDIPAGKPDPMAEEVLELGGRVCAGTPVTFRVSKDAGNLRMEADVPAVMLAPYVLH